MLALQSSTQQQRAQQKYYKIKLLNRKLEMENEVMENEIKNEFKNEFKVQTKYWHEC